MEDGLSWLLTCIADVAWFCIEEARTERVVLLTVLGPCVTLFGCGFWFETKREPGCVVVLLGFRDVGDMFGGRCVLVAMVVATWGNRPFPYGL